MHEALRECQEATGYLWIVTNYMCTLLQTTAVGVSWSKRSMYAHAELQNRKFPCSCFCHGLTRPEGFSHDDCADSKWAQKEPPDCGVNAHSQFSCTRPYNPYGYTDCTWNHKPQKREDESVALRYCWTLNSHSPQPGMIGLALQHPKGCVCPILETKYSP